MSTHTTDHEDDAMYTCTRCGAVMLTWQQFDHECARLLSCGHTATPDAHGTPGYVVRRSDGKSVCYDCSKKEQ